MHWFQHVSTCFNSLKNMKVILDPAVAPARRSRLVAPASKNPSGQEFPCLWPHPTGVGMNWASKVAKFAQLWPAISTCLDFCLLASCTTHNSNKTTVMRQIVCTKVEKIAISWLSTVYCTSGPGNGTKTREFSIKNCLGNWSYTMTSSGATSRFCSTFVLGNGGGGKWSDMGLKSWDFLIMFGLSKSFFGRCDVIICNY